MSRVAFLNLGCGNKYRKDWYNCDYVSDSNDVLQCNIIKGLPYPDNFFSVIYSS